VGNVDSCLYAKTASTIQAHLGPSTFNHHPSCDLTDCFEPSTDSNQLATMYRPTSNLPSHLRQSSLSTSNSQTSALQQRINEKRAELENLKQLRELSAGLAGQMEQLEEKLSTLSDGTQGASSCQDTTTSTDSCSNRNRSLQLAHSAQSNPHGFWYAFPFAPLNAFPC
jgi:hypothetical protein